VPVCVCGCSFVCLFVCVYVCLCLCVCVCVRGRAFVCVICIFPNYLRGDRSDYRTFKLNFTENKTLINAKANNILQHWKTFPVEECTHIVTYLLMRVAK